MQGAYCGIDDMRYFQMAWDVQNLSLDDFAEKYADLSRTPGK